MTTLQKQIKDLIFFYVKINYEKYLTDNKIQVIPEDKISEIINSIYSERKIHIQEFVKTSLRKIYTDKNEEYPGDTTVNNIFINIFQDDEYCKNRITIEITSYQRELMKKKI